MLDNFEEKQNEKLLEIRRVFSLMKRMGENVKGPENMLLYYNNIYPSIYLEEGLIKSYDIDKVIKFVSNGFGFKSDNKIDLSSIVPIQYNGEIYKEKSINDISEVIKIKLNDDFNDKDSLNTYMHKFGWFLSRIDDNILTYEKKYDAEFYCFQLKQITQYVYHITNKRFLDKILKNGLKPKSANNVNGYMHGDRIYFFLQEPEKEHYYLTSGSNNSVLLRIDLNKINEKTKFYFDIRLNEAIYCLEPIPNNAIEIIR